ncbi:MAG: hypothetical protein M1820_004961 [Bogoriella megaspora]|nr:MAG: hypothetical protein M1820_004961 [Bogoriella megaspora]
MFFLSLLAGAFTSTALAQGSYSSPISSVISSLGSDPNANYTLGSNGKYSPFTTYTIAAQNINATFIPYGARLTSLLVPDKDGDLQDIAVGYDDPKQYLTDSETNHTFFGAVVGRYANRIKNGTFDIDGATYQIPENENNGHDTLHGGKVGYDQRNWTVVSYSSDSVTFGFLDNALEGFPGVVYTQATYTVSNVITGAFGALTPRLTLTLTSNALTENTPIMLANHIYWNLDAFKSTNINNDTMWLPYAARYIDIDNIEIPTGDLSTVQSYPPLDFTVPKQIGRDVLDSHLAGFNSTGYDNAFIFDRPQDTGLKSSNFPTASIWSPVTGIKMDISTNQGGLQVYNCIGQNGTIPVKQSQQDRNKDDKDAAKYINKYACIVFETQDWIDGINNPQWGRQDWQIFGPESPPVVNYQTYDFSVVS